MSDHPSQPINTLPAALPVPHDLRDPAPAVFLDYDGTLTPIVADPDDALLTDDMRDALAALAEVAPVAIVSGRDLDDVREKVGLEGLAYAGSHGFDLRFPDGTRRQLATELTPALDAAERALSTQLEPLAGARIERKRFAIAIHDRQVEDAATRERIAEVARAVASDHPELRLTGGKRIHELRPDIDWDKGRAITALIDTLGLADRRPIYLGDDLTDEDGFRAVLDHGGWAVVVRGEDRDRPTLAQAALDDTEQAGALLRALAAAVTAEPDTPPG